MEKYSRIVIDLYKSCFTNHVKGSKTNDTEIMEACKELNSAIDKAKINNEPSEYLENLKKDIEYLKYELL